MGRSRVVVAVVTAGVFLFGPVATASAATLTEDARSLRNSIVTLTTDYEQDFGDRVSPEERTELAAMGAQARQDIGALVSALRKAERTKSSTDWRRARALHTAALTSAQARFDRAASLLQPRLTLREQIQAYSDYTNTLREFERLGQRIPAGR